MQVDLDGLQANILATIPLRFTQERNSVEQLIKAVKESDKLRDDVATWLHENSYQGVLVSPGHPEELANIIEREL